MFLQATPSYPHTLMPSHPHTLTHTSSQSEVKQNAEVAAYSKKFEEAEKMYLNMDRR